MPITSKVFEKLGWNFKQQLLDELDISDDESFLFMLSLESSVLMETIKEHAPSITAIQRLQMGQLADWYEQNSGQKGDSWIDDLSAKALRWAMIKKKKKAKKEAEKPKPIQHPYAIQNAEIVDPKNPTEDEINKLLLAGVLVTGVLVGGVLAVRYYKYAPAVARTITKVAKLAIGI
eukprot:CAMPEP_0119570460 /NCGR_PEP_ID=MMETSP1352-20130426/43624_1 /TAXON_ID=265584 /ORGANISM="Stauroneis constricta, Strain CCMP1120" /LENGTH=175 /DNA_ID=CAMNT_0007620129 /DNA_START=107 /DNA_END=634 /DNA_ORIENTATION=+